MAEPAGPLRPRQELGTELRRLRQVAGLGQQEIAARLGINQTKVSRLETGSFRPEMDVVRTWLNVVALDDSDERERLLRLAEAAQTDAVGWREFYRGTVATGQRRLVRQDTVAVLIRQFEPFEIPAAFQTPAYARQMILASSRDDEGDIDEGIAARAERGRHLRTPGAPQYQLIVTETALRFRPRYLDPPAHRDALRELVTAADASGITVQVIPVQATPERWVRSGFVISEFRADTGEPTVVDVELDPVDITTSRPDDITRFEKLWQRMADAALDPSASLALIKRIIDGK